MRNVAALLERESEGAALLHLAERSGILLLVRRGVLYLSRRIETGVVTLAEANGLRSQILAGLGLEVRRALDYFESHYEQNALNVLHTCGLDASDRESLAAELNLSVQSISFSQLFDGDCPRCSGCVCRPSAARCTTTFALRGMLALQSVAG